MLAVIHNTHERRFAIPPAAVGALLDDLASPTDRLWPPEWPPLRLDRPLAVGARGGHGPIRYRVDEFEPGRRVVFGFDPSCGLEGTHRLEVEPSAHGALLRHVVQARPRGRMRWAWPLAFRWLHDALSEDLLEQAERSVDRQVAQRRRSAWVRLLRWTLRPRPPARSAAVAGGGLLGAVGVLHTAWAVGATWPAPDAPTLARLVVGAQALPPAWATAVVAVLLMAAAALVLARGGVVDLPAPRWLPAVGTWTVAVTLGLRGAAGLVGSGVAVAAGVSGYPHWDFLLYSPLCLLLALLAGRVALGKPAVQA